MLETNLMLAKKKTQSKNMLLSFTGVNGAAITKDDYGRDLVTPGVISTMQSRHGGSSGRFVNQSIRLQEPIEIKGDFTMEAWVYLTAHTAGSKIMSLFADEKTPGQPSFSPIAILPTNYIVQWSLDAQLGLELKPVTLPLNTWHHIAASRQGTMYRNFFNGVVQSARTGPAVIGSVTHLLHHDAVDTRFHGYVDELRLLNGECIYTGNFTPPTSPFNI